MMLMGKTALLCSLLVVGCMADNKDDANSYMDRVAHDFLPSSVKSMSLDPHKLDDFDVKIEGTSFPYSREFHAKLREGTLNGLSNVVSRDGDCSSWKSDNVTVGCHILLGGIKAEYQVTSKGDELFGSTKEYTAVLEVTKIKVSLEITKHSNKPAYVRTFEIQSMELSFVTSKVLQLNQGRTEMYHAKAKQQVQNNIRELLSGSFRVALQLSAQSVPLNN
ncbi:uncharacterized protein LOC135399764 [Ornithodoros turicata]|uniref:uncharacterized protein LOC135399764 n=1 Tax=Ornithodoros turicata TaxID=34597 RepID=UPI003138BF5C